MSLWDAAVCYAASGHACAAMHPVAAKHTAAVFRRRGRAANIRTGIISNTVQMHLCASGNDDGSTAERTGRFISRGF